MDTDDAPRSYIYQALEDPSFNIRLLSIKSAKPSKIECSLRQVANLEQEKYNCLSYTWGDPFGKDAKHPDFPITCNGGHLVIGKNLHDAILHLYLVQAETLTSIWIDAVCINQKDEEEKDTQVKLMHDIYAGAESVIIWLGPEGEDKLTIPKFREVAQKIRDQKVGGWDSMRRITSGEVAERTDLPSLTSIDAGTWGVIADLVVHRSYWSRLWIWQEIMAAKEDPIIICGNYIILWTDMRDVSHAWLELGITVMIRQGSPPNTWVPTGMSTITMPHQLARWRDCYRDPQNGQPWIRGKFGMLVLQLNRNSYKCIDERDKIYAHLSICKYDKLQDWQYKKPFWELYIHFWSKIMDQSKEVNFLTFIEDATARTDRPEMKYDNLDISAPALPSWVPDLRASLVPGSMWDAYRDNETFNISKGLTGKWERSQKPTINGLDVNETLGRLRLRGYLFDTIEQFGETKQEIEDQESIPCILELITTILKEPSIPYDGPEEVVDAIWSVISIMGSIPHGIFPITPDQKKRARDWLLHTLAHSSIRDVGNDFTKKQDQLLGQLDELLGQSGGINAANTFPSRHICKEYAAGHKELPKKLDSQSMPRRLGELRQGPSKSFVGLDAVSSGDYGLLRMRIFRSGGNWIGKGPQSMQVGDEIWIVPGALVAFILRRAVSGTHVYVGHAYVHGIMQGEACSRFDVVKPEEIVLV